MSDENKQIEALACGGESGFLLFWLPIRPVRCGGETVGEVTGIVRTADVTQTLRATGGVFLPPWAHTPVLGRDALNVWRDLGSVGNTCLSDVGASSSPRLPLTDGDTKPSQAPGFSPTRCAWWSWDSVSAYSCLCPFPSVPGPGFLQGLLEAIATLGTEAQPLALRIAKEPAGSAVFGSRSNAKSSTCCCCSLHSGCGWSWRWGGWNQECFVKMQRAGQCGEM